MAQNSARYFQVNFSNWLNVYFLTEWFGGLVVYYVSQSSRQSFPIVLVQSLEPVIKLFYKTSKPSDLNN